MRAPHRSTLVVLALFGVVFVFGCTSLQNPRVVKIGMVAPFEGRYRDIGYDAIYAARLAVREINAAGGVEGWRLELVAFDDRGEPGLAARTAGNLAVDPDVVAVIGHFRPETSAVAEAIYARHGLPYLVIGGWGEGAGVTRYLSASPDARAQAITEAVDARGLTHGAVWGTGAIAAALTARGWTDAHPQMPDAPGDLVVSLLAPDQSGEWLMHWRRRGWSGQVIGGLDMASPTFSRIAGESVVGVRFVTPYPFPQDLEGIDPWVDAYVSMGPHVADPGPYALPTYEAVYLVADAVAAALREGVTGAPGRAGVGQALMVGRRQGMLGEIGWDAEGYWRDAPLYWYLWGDAEGAPSPQPSPVGGGSLRNPAPSRQCSPQPSPVGGGSLRNPAPSRQCSPQPSLVGGGRLLSPRLDCVTEMLCYVTLCGDCC